MKDLKDFMLIFRLKPNPAYNATAQEQGKEKQLWSAWIAGIAAQAKLVSATQLGFNGKQLSPDLKVSEGIYVSENETLGGNMIVKAESINEALNMAKGCPILNIGGTIEIRDTIPM